MTPLVYLSPPDVGPIERMTLLAAFDSGWIAPLGPWVDAFEGSLRTRLGAADVLATSSGTAALDLAYRVLGVGPGDVVACPTLTFIATVGPAVHLGATPLLIDSEPGSWCMDPGLLQQAIEEHQGRIRVVTVTHLYGQPAHMDPIRSVCQLYGIPIIEDAAGAIGATYRGAPVGTLGDLGVFSFNGNKIITTGGGGALATGRHPDLLARARLLTNQGKVPGVQYVHREVGFNYRLSNLLAAVGQGQLAQLTDKIKARRRVREVYRRHLDHPAITFQGEPADTCSNAWLTCIQVDAERFGATTEDLWGLLQAQGYEARPLFTPLDQQLCLRGCRVYGGGAVAGRLHRDGLCLPSGSNLTPVEQTGIINTIMGAAR